MLYNIHYDVCAVVISVLTVICVLTTKDVQRRENRVFLLIVLNGLLSGIFDIASAVATSYPWQVPYFVLSGLNFCYLTLHSCVAVLFYMYICLTNGKDIRFSLRRPAPFMLPWLCVIVVMVLNPFLNWVYYFDDQRRYWHGPMLVVLYFSATAYIIMAVFHVIRFGKAAPWKRKLLLLAFVSSAMLTVVVQILFPKILIELFFQAVIYLGILVSIDDEDATYDLVTRVYNRKTFLEDTQVRMQNGMRFDIIVLKLLNLDYYRNSVGIEVMNEVTYDVAHWLDGLDNAAKVYDLESGVFTASALSKYTSFAPRVRYRQSLYPSSYSCPSAVTFPAPPTLNMPHSRRSRKNAVPKLCQISIPLSMETFSFTGMIPKVTIRSTWL